MNEIERVNPVPSTRVETRSADVAQGRVTHFMGHAFAMVDQLKQQNQAKHLGIKSEGATAEAINKIYAEARQNIDAIDKRIKELDSMRGDSPLSKKEVEDLANLMTEVEKEIAEILTHTQIKVAAEIGSKGNENVRNRIEILAKGGWGARLIRWVSVISRTNQQAISGFKEAQFAMVEASKRDINKTLEEPKKTLEEPKIVRDKQDEFSHFQGGEGLKRRAGLIGLNGIYRIEVTFSEKQMHKQFKSYMAQALSQTERKTITKELEIKGEQVKSTQVKSTLVPLNGEFDEKVDPKTRLFEKIVGATGGISSANRQERHLINAWDSRLEKDGEVIYESLRHGITADKNEKNDEIRKKNSRQAAKELIQAALLKEIASRGLTLESFLDRGVNLYHNPLILNLNSVSLVTPDDLRAFAHGKASEKGMLHDQIEALHFFKQNDEDENLRGTPIKFDLGNGIIIPLHLNVTTFNFGVNAGAVDWLLGTQNQYKQNLKAFENLEAQTTPLLHFVSDANEVDKENVKSLLKDIKELMSDSTAYLKGDNQYEIGAKIINLTNVMDRIAKKSESKAVENVGFKSAFNCMSGKDRTGVMDCIAKTYALMASMNGGKYPTREELKNDAKVRQQFQEIVVPLLLESGSIEITKLNTGAIGYKVTKHALVGGISEEHFLDIIGLSKTTSS